MKNRNVFIIGFIIIILSLISCDNIGNHDIFNKSPFLALSDESTVDINVQYIRTQYFNDNSFHKSITIVTSTNELEQYYEKHKLRVFDGQGNLIPHEQFLDAIEKYTEKYFTENVLLIVGLIENSGSVRHKVEKIDENGNIFIMRLSPEMGTTDMASWSIIIELNKNLLLKKYQVILGNVMKKL